MLGWLVANVYTAPAVHLVVSGRRELVRGHERRDERWGRRFNWRRWADFMLVFPPYVFAFGGFVTVGRMLHAENSYQPC